MVVWAFTCPYLINCFRYTEAMQLNERLKPVLGGPRTAVREAMMDRYCGILPSLTKGYTTLKSKPGTVRYNNVSFVL